MKGCVFNTIQIPDNWENGKFPAGTNEGVYWYMQTSHFSAQKFYNELGRVEAGLSFSEPSKYFVNNFANNIEFFDILENTKAKEEVLQVLEYCYQNITTIGAMTKIAVAVLGDSVRISYYLEETPIRIVFSILGEKYDAWLTTPNNKIVLTTPDGIGLIAKDIIRKTESPSLMSEFFTQFVPPEKYVKFEFNWRTI